MASTPKSSDSLFSSSSSSSSATSTPSILDRFHHSAHEVNSIIHNSGIGSIFNNAPSQFDFKFVISTNHSSYSIRDPNPNSNRFIIRTSSSHSIRNVPVYQLPSRWNRSRSPSPPPNPYRNVRPPTPFTFVPETPPTTPLSENDDHQRGRLRSRSISHPRARSMSPLRI